MQSKIELNPLRQPDLPIPEPLRGADLGTFAHSSVVVRLPDIARRTLADNSFSPETVSAIQAMIDEIPDEPLRWLTDMNAPDSNDWQEYLTPYIDHPPEINNWLEPPWFFVETYFYRRILEATQYFQMDFADRFDPFLEQKRRGLEVGKNVILQLRHKLEQWISQGYDQRKLLVHLLRMTLWGNQADLSLWPVDQDNQVDTDALNEKAATMRSNIIIDDTNALVEYLFSLTPNKARVDFIIDNAGVELIYDLVLADFLLSREIAGSVYFHLKFHPTFVSDATVTDVNQTVSSLVSDDNVHVCEKGVRLSSHLKRDLLILRDHAFWTSPLSMWEMPDDLYSELAESDLIISKGDANYRRLLGDRHWRHTVPFNQVANYLRLPYVALRVIKSEVAIGLDETKHEFLHENRPGWMTNGKWGMIQFINPLNNIT